MRVKIILKLILLTNFAVFIHIYFNISLSPSHTQNSQKIFFYKKIKKILLIMIYFF